MTNPSEQTTTSIDLIQKHEPILIINDQNGDCESLFDDHEGKRRSWLINLMSGTLSIADVTAAPSGSSSASRGESISTEEQEEVKAEEKEEERVEEIPVAIKNEHEEQKEAQARQRILEEKLTELDARLTTMAQENENKLKIVAKQHENKIKEIQAIHETNIERKQAEWDTKLQKLVKQNAKNNIFL